MSSRRLNLTLPEHFDELLEELAALSGRSKVSYVLDAIKYSTPFFKRDLAQLRRALGARVPSADVQVAAAQVAPVDGSATSDNGVMPKGLNSKGRREWRLRHGKGK